jgi:hypothetical protein
LRVTDVQLRTIFGEIPRRELASLDPDWPRRLPHVSLGPIVPRIKSQAQKGSFSPAYHDSHRNDEVNERGLVLLPPISHLTSRKSQGLTTNIQELLQLPQHFTSRTRGYLGLELGSFQLSVDFSYRRVRLFPTKNVDTFSGSQNLQTNYSDELALCHLLVVP